MIAIIVAMSENRVIGREGKIPWDLPEDRKKFQMLTMGNAIVMGRRTYDEIGHPLPGRMTYLLSGTKKVELENCHTVQSLEEVWEKEKNTGGISLSAAERRYMKKRLGILIKYM